MSTIKGVINKFNAIARIKKDEVVLQAVSRGTLDFARKQFQSHGKYGGKPWAFFAAEPKYLAFKEAMGAMPLPLRWTSTMQRIYPALTNPNHADRVLSKNGNNIYLKIDIPYLSRIEQGGINQFGERFRGRQIFPNKNQRLQKDVADLARQDYYAKVRSVK